MTNMTIIVEKVTRPEVFANALQKEINTVQVHRRNNFWDYKAVEAAQAELSLTAFQLYMYLERQNTNTPWCVWPSKLAKETQLNEFNLPGAVLELKKKGYLTPGKIDWDGQQYETNVFHFWERPELCDIDYGDDAA